MTRSTPLVLGVSMDEPDPPLAAFALPFIGPVIAFYGKNGSGKTRLLNALAHAVGVASAPEGAAPYLLHVELVPGASGQPPPFDLAAGLHRALVQLVAADRLRQAADEVNQGGEEPWTESLLFPEHASIQSLVEAILRASGATPELAAACAAQQAWVLEREADEGYHAQIGLRCNGDMLPLLQACRRNLEVEAATGSSEPYAVSRRARLLRSIDDLLAAGSPQDPPWLARGLVSVIVDDGATQPAISLAEVKAAAGAVTEDGLSGALAHIAWDLQMSLPTSRLTVTAPDTWAAPVQVTVEGPAHEHLQRLSRTATELLRTCLPQGPEIQLRLASPWSSRGLVEVVAVDVMTGAVVGLDELSRAENRWATIAVQLAAHTDSGPARRCLLLMDEPDADLHPVARRQVARGLAELAERLLAVCVITTHAAEFLSLPGSSLYNVTRDADGAHAIPLRAQDIITLDAARAATELGLTRGDLLSLTRAFVIVEGEHDAALVRTWLAEELSSVQASVLPLRGTPHLNTILDCQMLLTYTTAEVVIVVDRARDVLRAAWEDAMSGPVTQRSKRLAASRKRIQSSGRESPEEAKLWELMNAAVASHAAKRLHIHPLSKPDVMEYLPAHRVTSRPEDTWSALVQQWGHVGDFKTWLRQRGAEISSSRLAYLAADLPPPAEFRALGSAIVRHVEKGLRKSE